MERLDIPARLNPIWYTTTTHMFPQDLCHSAPTLSQVLFPILGEEDGETALLGKRAGDVVGFCERVDLPVVDIVRVPCYRIRPVPK
jgi:hypothetical protein